MNFEDFDPHTAFIQACYDQTLDKRNAFSNALRQLDVMTLERLVIHEGHNVNQPIQHYERRSPRPYRPRSHQFYDHLFFGEHPLTHLVKMSIDPTISPYAVIQCTHIILTEHGSGLPYEASNVEYIADRYRLTPADYALLSPDNELASMIIIDKLKQDMKQQRELFTPQLNHLFLMAHMNEEVDCEYTDWVCHIGEEIVQWIDDIRDSMPKSQSLHNYREASLKTHKHLENARDYWASFSDRIIETEEYMKPCLRFWRFQCDEYTPSTFALEYKDVVVKEVMDMLVDARVREHFKPRHP